MLRVDIRAYEDDIMALARILVQDPCPLSTTAWCPASYSGCMIPQDPVTIKLGTLNKDYGMSLQVQKRMVCVVEGASTIT